MSLAPSRRTVTNPLEPVRIVGSFDDHVASLVTSLTVPSENVAVAVNWLVNAD
jgi:hypothetical protein